jgi:PAS domain-containing protein
MVGLGLKLRYVAAVLTVGALLTAAVAVVTHYSETAEHEKLRAVDEQLDAIPALDPRLAAAQEQLHGVVEEVSDGQTVNIAIAGGLLTLMAGMVVLLIMVRIDRALVALMDNAQSIGRGRYAEPIAVSGVAETAALESSLEQMRQALTTTTISRDFLDDVLNGIKDAVLVMTTDGRMRTANAAATRLFGMPEQRNSDTHPERPDDSGVGAHLVARSRAR